MRKKIKFFILLSLIYIIGFPFLKEYVLDAPYMFVIEITGEKNEASGGTEIWIDSVLRDGVELEMNGLHLGEGWENRGRLFHRGDKSTDWKLCIRSREQTVITFVTHPYSGIVKIKGPKGNTATVDLYSPEEGRYRYTIDIR